MPLSPRDHKIVMILACAEKQKASAMTKYTRGQSPMARPVPRSADHRTRDELVKRALIWQLVGLVPLALVLGACIASMLHGGPMPV